MLRTPALTAIIALTLVLASAAPASAGAGYTSGDLQVTGLVAVVGQTGTLTVTGRMSKDLLAAYPNGVEPRPAYTLQQSCSDGSVAAHTGDRFSLPSYPIGHPVQTSLTAAAGNWTAWSVSWTLDPGDIYGELVALGFSLCSGSAIATGPISVQSMTLHIWPGCACSNVIAKNGQSLYVAVTVNEGHTKVR